MQGQSAASNDVPHDPPQQSPWSNWWFASFHVLHLFLVCCTYACNALVVDTLNSNLMLVLWYDICVPLWIIVMYVICGVWRWYIYVIYVLCNISMLWNISVLWYIYVLRNVMQKQKKIHISEALPSVMTKTLGKANTICRVLSPRHSANMKYLPSVGIITLGDKLFF